MIGRRSFVRGLAAGAVITPLAAQRAAATSPSLLSGTEFRLELAPVAVNVTGRPRPATLINGLLPGPTLRWREGDTVTLAVTNRLPFTSSLHWHGIRLPAAMDGVPGFTYAGIAPGETFVYRFPVRQSGTYWYHAHGLEEQTGAYGSIVIEPRGGFANRFDRDYVVVLSDWSDESPRAIVGNLKFQSSYYNRHQRTVGTFLDDARRDGLGATVSDRLMWGDMRMSPTDILDVSGATYTYLMNGQPPAANWTALFRPGERVRLRFIDAGAMSIFDLRIPGLPMTVVQSDGNDIVPVTVDELRIAPGETYDVIVEPRDDRAYAIFAQAEDRTGYASGTLAPRPGMAAAIPAMDPRPLRTMADMGMSHAGVDHSKMDHSKMDHATAPGSASLAGRVGVDNVVTMPRSRLAEAGDGLEDNGRRVLRLSDLRATRPGSDPRPASRELVSHLTGNMERFIWGFDGTKFSDAGPIRIALNERVRFTLVNDTMMEHPMHLHGFWSELENGQGAYRPYKHTILVKPAEQLSYLVTADTPGRWAFHCHLLYHMETGMMREVRVE
ncbi:MAG: copper resistance system multicopper oxidase [Reyranellaceae bacterium]